MATFLVLLLAANIVVLLHCKDRSGSFLPALDRASMRHAKAA